MSKKDNSNKCTHSSSWKVSRRVGLVFQESIDRLHEVYTHVIVSGEVKRTEYGCKVRIYFKRRGDCNSKCAISLHVTDEFHENFFTYLTHLIEAHCLTLVAKGTAGSQVSSDSD